MLHWDNRTADGFGPIRDVLDQRYVNWSLAGSFEALPYLADRLIILPREKLVSPIPRPPPHLSPAPCPPPPPPPMDPAHELERPPARHRSCVASRRTPSRS